jgi:ATP-dependent Clp protease ATP-binding subunit ClpC
VDFKNTVIIMTSNVGTLRPSAAFGFGTEEQKARFDEMSESMLRELRRIFRPELLNRVDEIIVFHPLTKDQIVRIVDLMVEKVRAQLAERQISLQLSEAARQLLAEKGFDEEYGARPLRRTIQRLVENPISRGLLEQQFREGDTIIVDAQNGEIVPRLLVESKAAAS